MDLIFYIFIFLFGLIIGSFLNSVIYRLEEGMPIWRWSNRSICPHCKKQLRWFELIPVISFIIQKGRCTACPEKISWQYPFVELATGLLFVGIMNYELGIMGYELNSLFLIQTIYFLIVSSLLILIFVFDYKHYIIPNQFVYSLIILSLGYNILYSLFIIHNSSFLIQAVLSALLLSGFFLSLVLISKGEWMGMGDVKFALFMGLFLGWPKIFVAFFMSFFIGSIISLALVARGEKGMQSQIPFGPFLIIGTLIALFWSDYLITFII